MHAKNKFPGWRGMALIVLGVTALAVAQQPVPSRPAAAQTATPQATPQTTPGTTIVTGVTVVNVPVLVLDHSGAPVIGLDRNNFQILDDGRPQSLASFDNQPRPVTLAIVIDTSNPDAVAQAHRSAELLAQMVVGNSGQAGIFIASAEAKQVLPFTGDLGQIVDALRRLRVGPRSDGIGEPLSMAVMALARQPRDRTRAVLVISRQSPRSDSFSQAIMETSMNDATPIFQLSPNRPRNANDVNPIDPNEAGTGVGSNRAPIPPSVSTHGKFPPAAGSAANFDLGAAISGALGTIRSHQWDYVHTTGGLSLKASNDGDFDRKLGEIGNALRSIYELYYHPNDLSPQARLHQIEVQVQAAVPDSTVTYRRAYLGYRAR